jgi:hypothetical protein
LVGLSPLIKGSEDKLASRLRPCIAELMDTSRYLVIRLGRGETGMGLERNDVTRASFLGTPFMLQYMNGFGFASFENVGKMGLPLAMGACPGPSRVLAVATVLAFDAPLGIAVISALVKKGFCVAVCDPFALLFVAGLACRGIRPWAAAGLGRVEEVKVGGLTPDPTLAENKVLGLPRGGEFLVMVGLFASGTGSPDRWCLRLFVACANVPSTVRGETAVAS